MSLSFHPSLRLGCEVRCPGCRHRSLSAEESQTQKFEWLRRQLDPFELMPLRAVLESKRWGYRSKTCVHAHWSGSRWEFGLLTPVPGKKFEYEVVDIPACPVHTVAIQKIISHLAGVLPPYEVFPLVNLAISGTLLTFVLKTSKQLSIPAIDWEGLGITGVYYNLNPSAGNRVFASKGWKLVWGEPRARDPRDGWVYGPESFQQLIADLHEGSVNEAKSFFTAQGLQGVMDLYSGSGRTLREWRSLGLPCIGVELGGESFACAQLNLGESEILRGKVSDRRPQLELWAQTLESDALGVYLNPPRTGLEEGVASWLGVTIRPKVVAYLSCSAGTLARDLRILTGSGYSVIKIIPYDFFPQTHHVEVLTLLVRQKS